MSAETSAVDVTAVETVMHVLRLQLPLSSGNWVSGRRMALGTVAKSNLHLLHKRDVAPRSPTCHW